MLLSARRDKTPNQETKVDLLFIFHGAKYSPSGTGGREQVTRTDKPL